MYLPFPERIPLWYAVTFALGLAGLQIIQGTDPYFCFGTTLFILGSTLAFNVAGGFSRPSGTYIFLNALLTAILGITYKAWLGEPAQSNLLNPHMTIMVYDVGMGGMLAAAYLSKRFSRREGWLQEKLPLHGMQSAVYGCVGAGLFIIFLNNFADVGGNGSVLSAVNQVDRFMTMGILLGVTHQIRKTGGRSSLSWIVIFVIVLEMAYGGLLSFSKEAFVTPLMAWLLTAASMRYRFSLPQALGILAGVFFLFHYLVPYSQYGRGFREVDTTISAQVARAGYLLTHLEETRQMDSSQQADAYQDNTVHYYDSPQGFWDRLQMLAIDDQIINYTEKNQSYGYFPIIFGFENMVPRFLWKDKPIIIPGNLYAHEIDLLSPDDMSTGISFSPSGEAWHLGRWICLTVVTPMLWLAFFLIFDSLAGDVRKSPWGLLAIIIFAHVASEGGVSFLIYDLAYGVAGMLIVAYFSAKIMPHLGSVLVGPGRLMTRGKTRTIQSVPRRGDAL